MTTITTMTTYTTQPQRVGALVAHHPGWVITPVGPGKDIHGTLGPLRRKAVGGDRSSNKNKSWARVLSCWSLPGPCISIWWFLIQYKWQERRKGRQVVGGLYWYVSRWRRQRDDWTSKSECVCPGCTELSVFEWRDARPHVHSECTVLQDSQTREKSSGSHVLRPSGDWQMLCQSWTVCVLYHRLFALSSFLECKPPGEWDIVALMMIKFWRTRTPSFPCHESIFLRSSQKQRWWKIFITLLRWWRHSWNCFSHTYLFISSVSTEQSPICVKNANLAMSEERDLFWWDSLTHCSCQQICWWKHIHVRPWIRGNTKIGIVLEVTTGYLQGKFVLESELNL